MTIHAWGDNELATLGLGKPSHVVPHPTPTLPSWDEVVHIIASASHTIGLVHSLFVADGQVLAMGDNEWSQLGTGTRYVPCPDPVPIGLAAYAVAAGPIHSVALS